MRVRASTTDHRDQRAALENLPHGLEGYYAPYTFWAVAAGAFLLGVIVRASLPKPKA